MKQMKTIDGEVIEIEEAGFICSSFFGEKAILYKDSAGKFYYQIEKSILAECVSESIEDALEEMKGYIDDVEREDIEAQVDDWIAENSPKYDDLEVDYYSIRINNDGIIECDTDKGIICIAGDEIYIRN
ncbi:hypothetical protein SAMN05216390_1472 [Lachnospiraceae bacterium KH1T2]|nr:hypothetical protein SAMN05216390_1472 [Lachnospiraceae bacterium KH1T2]